MIVSNMIVIKYNIIPFYYLLYTNTTLKLWGPFIIYKCIGNVSNVLIPCNTFFFQNSVALKFTMYNIMVKKWVVWFRNYLKKIKIKIILIQ